MSAAFSCSLLKSMDNRYSWITQKQEMESFPLKIIEVFNKRHQMQEFSPRCESKMLRGAERHQ